MSNIYSHTNYTEPSPSWLRDFNGASFTARLKNTCREWQNQPLAYSNLLPLTRSKTLACAMLYSRGYDFWDFEQADYGAFSLIVDGPARAKRDLVISLASPNGDAFGFYIVLRPLGAEVWRRMIYGQSGDEHSQPFMRDVMERSTEYVHSVEAPLERPGKVGFTVVYDHGSFFLYDGVDPNHPGQLLVSYANQILAPGITKWGVGLLQVDEQDDLRDTLTIVQVRKWVK